MPIYIYKKIQKKTNFKKRSNKPKYILLNTNLTFKSLFSGYCGKKTILNPIERQILADLCQL